MRMQLGNTTIGLVPMSAKPFHQGHFMLIERAATECDEVYVFGSLGDRKRSGEVPIVGSTMDMIWHRYLEGIMPHNVDVEYVKVPVRAVYEHLGEAEESGSTSDFAIYGDPTDVEANFPPARLVKYCPRLISAKKITNIGVNRTSTFDVSGTRMREMLAQNNKRGFTAALPDPLSPKARGEIWSALQADIVDQS